MMVGLAGLVVLGLIVAVIAWAISHDDTGL